MVFLEKNSNKKINKTFSELDLIELENHQKINKDNLIKEYNITINYNDNIKSNTGIKNYGNNCYINSVLQCLININIITNYFFSNRFINDLNIVNTFGSQGIVALNYHNFIKDYIINNNSYVSPKNFIKSFKNINYLFDGITQQDSQEFLSFIMDILLEDTNKILKKPYLEIKDYDGENLEEYANYCWDIFEKRNDSIISDYFYGQFKTTIYCSNCEYISYNYEPFNILSLPIKINNKSLDFFIIFFSKKKHFSIKANISKNINFSILVNNLLNIPINELILVNFDDGKLNEIYQDYSKFTVDDIIKNQRYFFIQRIWDSKLMNKNIDLSKGNLIQFQIYIDESIVSISQMLFIPIEYNNYDIYLLAFINIRKYLKKLFKNDESNYNFNDYEKEFNKTYFKKNKFFTWFINNKIIKIIDNSNTKFNNDNNIIKANIINKKPFNKINYKKAIIKNINLDKEKINIINLINNLNKIEKLGEDNKWKCIKCKEYNLPSYKIEINKLPKLLIIHYKKFKKEFKKMKKINKKIDCDIILDLNDYVIQKQKNINYIYDLISIIDHIGTINSGHYISKTRIWNSNNWYENNDKNVKKIKINSLISEDNYILFFKRNDI